MNVDDLLSGMHNDKIASLDDRLRAIDLELNTRRLLSQERTARLFEQLQTLHEEILRLRPEGEHSADPNRMTRTPLEREHRELERVLEDEHRQRWTDEQHLRREQRELRQARLEQWQHYERHLKPYDS